MSPRFQRIITRFINSFQKNLYLSLLSILARTFIFSSIIILAGGLLYGELPSAQAASSTIGCGDTAGFISAIKATNTNGQTNVINLTASCNYVINAVDNTTADGPNGLPDITSNLTINGNNATISRNSTAPVFRILHVASAGNLTLNNLVISGSDAGSKTGGGVYNLGTLNLNATTFSNNKAIFGSAINNFSKSQIQVIG